MSFQSSHGLCVQILGVRMVWRNGLSNRGQQGVRPHLRIANQWIYRNESGGSKRPCAQTITTAKPHHQVAGRQVQFAPEQRKRVRHTSQGRVQRPASLTAANPLRPAHCT